MLELLLIVILIFLLLFYGGYAIFGLAYGKVAFYKGNDIFVPTVSLVIPTCDEEATIFRKIDNLLEIDYPKGKLEIIFVDSSRDKTAEIIQNFMHNAPIHVSMLSEPQRKGLAAALNQGYAAASGEIIIKSDCDMILRKDFVKSIVTYFSNQKIGAVSGAIEVLNSYGTEVGYRTIFEKLRLAEANLDSTYVFNAFAFRSRLVESIDERSVADDAELALKIRKKGYKTVYAPDAIIYETSPTQLRARIKQKSRRAQGHIRLAFQNRGILFNPRYGKFGLFIFPANFFMVIVLPWLILFWVLLAGFELFRFMYPFSIFILPALAILLSIMYAESKPKLFAGFVEAQLSLIVAAVTILVFGPQFSWRRIPSEKKSNQSA